MEPTVESGGFWLFAFSQYCTCVLFGIFHKNDTLESPFLIDSIMNFKWLVGE
ncbi:unnamed protein product [Sphenostylis stenocarpa]|uniref:Uncharacterized protein n=1 Tax=Sphenostylis stenocarpa TaxID=92480 RepID=A0AA86SYD6_9FABA|nr:unnamed protein product [Sphenostylis stenocarpa]